MMKFKRSKLLADNILAGYLSSTSKDNSRKIKFSKKHLTKPEGYNFFKKASFTRQSKCITPMTFSQKYARADRKVFTIKELFDKYESQSDSVYLEAVKFLLEQLFLLSEDLTEE